MIAESELQGRILTVEEVARYLPYSRKHLQRLCRDKVLPASRPPKGRRWFIDGDALLALLKVGGLPPPEAEPDGPTATPC
jgi:excisionase family DNA binding protein